MDFAKINELSKKYEPQMTKFLRDMIAIPSESCQEEGVVKRIKKEMEDVGFDRVEIDKMGNVIGYIGKGSRLIAFDAHIDTVGIGERANWTFDPYQGYEDAETIGGKASTAKGDPRGVATFLPKGTKAGRANTEETRPARLGSAGKRSATEANVSAHTIIGGDGWI